MPVSKAKFTEIPPEAEVVRVAYLPAMSGLESEEFERSAAEIAVRIGEGRPAGVLRNLCMRLARQRPAEWATITTSIHERFGCQLREPDIVPGRGDISLTYIESGTELDIVSAGRGLHQTLLLLTHIHLHPGTVYLLDEPDAHLEVIRQRDTFDLVKSTAVANGSQVIAATHSEAVMDAAADEHVVVGFFGASPRIIDKDSRRKARQSLTNIPFNNYVQAERLGWVLYTEGSSDFTILKAMANRLRHPVQPFLDRAYAVFLQGNDVKEKAIGHFKALSLAIPSLRGIVVTDRLNKDYVRPDTLTLVQWQRREIENYIGDTETLMAFARGSENSNIFTLAESDERATFMAQAIDETLLELGVTRSDTDGSDSTFASEQAYSQIYLPPIFNRYYRYLGLSQLSKKSSFSKLVDFLSERASSHPDITRILDAILEVANSHKAVD